MPPRIATQSTSAPGRDLKGYELLHLQSRKSQKKAKLRQPVSGPDNSWRQTAQWVRLAQNERSDKMNSIVAGAARASGPDADSARTAIPIAATRKPGPMAHYVATPRNPTEAVFVNDFRQLAGR